MKRGKATLISNAMKQFLKINFYLIRCGLYVYVKNVKRTLKKQNTKKKNVCFEMRDNLTDRLRFAVMSFTVCEQLKLNNLLNAHADLNERRFCSFLVFHFKQQHIFSVKIWKLNYDRFSLIVDCVLWAWNNCDCHAKWDSKTLTLTSMISMQIIKN